jgi:hypothetical protein
VAQRECTEWLPNKHLTHRKLIALSDEKTLAKFTEKLSNPPVTLNSEAIGHQALAGEVVEV